MGSRKPTTFLELRVYRQAEILADTFWNIVMKWPLFAKLTVGRQLVNAADSIGSNIAEGTGRGSFQDNKRFTRIARASFNETRHWLRRAHKRNLLKTREIEELSPMIRQLAPMLNAYLRSIGLSEQTTASKDKGPRTND